MQLLETQLQALEEILALTIADPQIRLVLGECNLRRLSPEYREPDLILSTSKVLSSIENTHVHSLWSELIRRREYMTGSTCSTNFAPPQIHLDALKMTLW